mmetsp:Transcript_17076/g.55711  ORF Transcript_17076/g.55711 Transcript_17076/m.55711 type:complete len:220 (+) Transcript_17076:1520-2179(+)
MGCTPPPGSSRPSPSSASTRCWPRSSPPSSFPTPHSGCSSFSSSSSASPPSPSPFYSPSSSQTPSCRPSSARSSSSPWSCQSTSSSAPTATSVPTTRYWRRCCRRRPSPSAPRCWVITSTPPWASRRPTGPMATTPSRSRSSCSPWTPCSTSCSPCIWSACCRPSTGSGCTRSSSYFQASGGPRPTRTCRHRARKRQSARPSSRCRRRWPEARQSRLST